MIDYFFAQYQSYTPFNIFLEVTAVVFGLFSVWFAKKDNILVFPTGLVSTFIYAYLLWKWDLLGDSMINGYYFFMSIYGWFIWSRKRGVEPEFPISCSTRSELRKATMIFIATIIFVIFVYFYFDKFSNWFAYLDTFVTALFFVAMWLMAKRKIENWVLWMIGDAISIPLYFIKGYTFTSFQYVVFTIFAVFAYIEWKQKIKSQGNS